MHESILRQSTFPKSHKLNQHSRPHSKILMSIPAHPSASGVMGNPQLHFLYNELQILVTLAPTNHRFIFGDGQQNGIGTINISLPIQLGTTIIRHTHVVHVALSFLFHVVAFTSNQSSSAPNMTHLSPNLTAGLHVLGVSLYTSTEPGICTPFLSLPLPSIMQIVPYSLS